MLDVLRWKKDQRTYYSHTTTARWLSTSGENEATRGREEIHFRGREGSIPQGTCPPSKKIQTTRGRETRAREVKDPNLSMANHLLDLGFKPVDLWYWPKYWKGQGSGGHGSSAERGAGKWNRDFFFFPWSSAFFVGFLSFFISWVVNTQLNHRTKRAGSRGIFELLLQSRYATTQLALQLHQERT